MNGATLLAGLLAAASNTADEWASVPTVRLDGQTISVPAAEPKARPESAITMVEVPESPPLTAQKNPDGTIRLEHKTPETSPKRGEEAPK